MAAVRKWTTTENQYLMQFGYRKPWEEIAQVIGRSPEACKKHYDKIRELRQAVGTWRGL